MINRLKLLDIFGKSMTFENDSTRKFHSVVGGVSSLVLAVICIVLALVLGSDFYQRKVESVTSSEKINDSTTLTLNDLPLLIAFFSNGFVIGDPFEVVSLNVRKMTLNGPVSFEYFDKFEFCSPNKFVNYQDAVEDLIKTTSFQLICYDSNSTEYVKNSLGDNDSVTYFIEVTKCDSNVRKCHPNLESILKGFYTVIYYVNDYLNPTEFDLPLTPHVESYSQFLIKGFTKSHFLKTAKYTFSSDNGWFLESMITHDYLSVFSITSDINTSIVSRYNNKEILYSLALQTTKVTKTTVRRYMKITDVFAKIGGLVTILYYVFKAIISIYSSFLYTYLIRDLFFETVLKEHTQKVSTLIQPPQGINIKLPNEAPQFHVQNDATVYEGGVNQSSIQITPIKRTKRSENQTLNFLNYLISSIICCYNKRRMKLYKREKAEVHRALSIKSYIGLLKEYTSYEFFKKDADSYS